MSYGQITPPPRYRGAGVPQPTPTPIPQPSGGAVLYDSRIHSALHNGIARQVRAEGNIGPNGKGVECRASGNPYIRVNTDKTFSLICGAGHGRFYGYVNNYNATMEIVCAWGNQVSGQDLSLKLRSRHNEPDPCNNRFGGYGFACDRRGWGAKREPCHNNHDLAVSGGLPSQLGTQQYFMVLYTVRDDPSGGVREIASIDGRPILNRVLQRQPLPIQYFGQKSYYWVRQNVDSGTGELRIRSLRILQA